jgi:hypothetical protein
MILVLPLLVLMSEINPTDKQTREKPSSRYEPVAGGLPDALGMDDLQCGHFCSPWC